MAETPILRRVRLAAPFAIFGACVVVKMFDDKLNRLDLRLQLTIDIAMAIALAFGVGLAIFNMIERRRNRATPKVFD